MPLDVEARYRQPAADRTAYIEQEKQATAEKETELVRAQTELEKTKTGYFIEQLKTVPLPDKTFLDITQPVVAAKGSPLLLLGALAYFFMRKGKR
ncbi:MAG: hypothetical protein HWN68_16620 [Desulfobacterales bacterium]|nr:hypothetical protein [Desulfobacterales bacterium]